MNDISRFLKQLKKVTLSNNERLALRERLALYADMHPALAAPAIASPYASFFSFIGSGRFSTYALSLMILIAAGGGITLGAEGSAPGDSLYALKVNVNEPLMTALATTPTKQAKVAANIATRRIDEAVTLAGRGTLTPERQEYLSTQFTKRVTVAAEKADELATLDSTAAHRVKADLAANLAGEAQALSAIPEKERNNSSELLRAVIATSETIADHESALATAEAATTSDTTLQTTAAKSSVHIERVRLTAKGKSATSTPDMAKVNTTVPVRITPTMTFSTRFASTTSLKAILAPKVDVAIPARLSDEEDRSGFNIER
jgi:hypothetical protein